MGALAANLASGCVFDTSGFNWPSDEDASVPSSDASVVDARASSDAPVDAEPEHDALWQDPDAASLDAEPADAVPPDANAGDPILEDVAHVPAAGEFATTADLVLGNVTIDTGDLTIDGSAPIDGAVFDNWAQEPWGPQLSVLHVRTLTIQPDTTVLVRGNRPLVILASGVVSIQGLLDAGAEAGTPGPAGRLAGGGGGVGGGDGEHVADYQDSGGGGGGAGTAGARGGHAICEPDCADAMGGAGGNLSLTASLITLWGGPGGGNSGALDCPVGAGGAGGGVVQIYSGTSIDIDPGGAINAGGGGGGGGTAACAGSASAGGGGGAGGPIYLQAPSITHNGTIAANGGGGGGGASSAGTEGGAGADGALDADPAVGGTAGGDTGKPGGNGGALDTPPEPGVDDLAQGNGGGGGGAAGRIAFFVNATGTLTTTGITSPAPYTGTY